ncbi:MAG: hypothetical protein GMKNLPBB_00533 [Myxococcota bacterium]|nr:hypothetical protein [Myxococcota bacterium]
MDGMNHQGIALAPFLAFAAAGVFACTTETPGGASGGGGDAGSGPSAIMDASPAGADGATTPSTGEPRPVVPSDGLPSTVTVQNANNNLDVAIHNGRYFLAFRTAPKHFASNMTELYVVSSADQQTWEFEARYAEGTDLREPRFLPWNGKLFLYYSVLGDNPVKFEPKGMKLTEYLGPGKWSPPEPFYDPGFIVWRTRVIDGKPYMLAYTGGENIYEVNGKPLEVHWLTTSDGRKWDPVVPGRPVVLRGGSSETDFAFAGDGAVIAVSRNEAGDDMGWGSKICRAEKTSPGDWKCVADPRKYDSPLVFSENGHIWLIGRRNLNNRDGAYDLGMRRRDPKDQTYQYQIDYWKHPKRCSLWKIDPVSLKVEFVLDLPSRGDTCFPGMVPAGPGEYDVYNYTSPLDGPDIDWVTGQGGHTLIYRIRLKFPVRNTP